MVNSLESSSRGPDIQSCSCQIIFFINNRKQTFKVHSNAAIQCKQLITRPVDRLPIHPSVDYFPGMHCFEAQGVDYFFEVLITIH